MGRSWSIAEAYRVVIERRLIGAHVRVFCTDVDHGHQLEQIIEERWILFKSSGEKVALGVYRKHHLRMGKEGRVSMKLN